MTWLLSTKERHAAFHFTPGYSVPDAVLPKHTHAGQIRAESDCDERPAGGCRRASASGSMVERIGDRSRSNRSHDFGGPGRQLLRYGQPLSENPDPRSTAGLLAFALQQRPYLG